MTLILAKAERFGTMLLQLSDDSPAILLSCPEAKQNGEVKLTAAEALQLAGALVSLARQAGHDTAYARGDPSPCCPGDELTPYPIRPCGAPNAAPSRAGRLTTPRCERPDATLAHCYGRWAAELNSRSASSRPRS